MATGFGGTFGDIALASTAAWAVGDTFGARGCEPGKAAAAGRQAMRAEGAPVTGEGAPAQSDPRTVVTGVAAEIREFARLRDEGLISDEQFIEQRNRLLDISPPSPG
ncbi:SHOCT domain-containing protein [Mycobacterium sp.]|uniref:SHOCT domain-containing protein n=1 Tax=Mycobacterium sp. TaxID=1785 RepID=UPI003F954B77